MIAGVLVGGFSFGFLMRFHDFLPGVLEQIPYVGIWLKLLLALFLGIATFTLTVVNVYEALTPKTKPKP